MRILLAMCFALLLLAAGCVAPAFVFDPERAEKYIRKTPGVDQDIAAALRRGEPVRGMTRKEVSICLGTPSEKTLTTESGSRVETWLYTTDGHVSGELRGSSLWNRRIPLAKVVFGDDETMVLWHKYTGKGASTTENGGREDAEHSGSRQDVQGTPSLKGRRLLRVFDEDNFRGWPGLTVKGTSTGAGRPSAVINNTVVSAGNTILGVKIVAIDPRGVTLNYKGEVQFLPVGKSTH